MTTSIEHEACGRSTGIEKVGNIKPFYAKVENGKQMVLRSFVEFVRQPFSHTEKKWNKPICEARAMNTKHLCGKSSGTTNYDMKAYLCAEIKFNVKYLMLAQAVLQTSV